MECLKCFNSLKFQKICGFVFGSIHILRYHFPPGFCPPPLLNKAPHLGPPPPPPPRLLPMCRGELFAVNAQLMSKCLWNRWQWGVKEVLSSFPSSPVICEWLWKNTQTGFIEGLQDLWKLFVNSIYATGFCQSITRKDI